MKLVEHSNVAKGRPLIETLKAAARPAILATLALGALSIQTIDAKARTVSIVPPNVTIAGAAEALQHAITPSAQPSTNVPAPTTPPTLYTPNQKIKSIYYLQAIQMYQNLQTDSLETTFNVASSDAKITMLMLSCPTDKDFWIQAGVRIVQAGSESSQQAGGFSVTGFYQIWDGHTPYQPANGLTGSLPFNPQLGGQVKVSMKLMNDLVSISLVDESNPTAKTARSFAVKGSEFIAPGAAKHYCGPAVEEGDPSNPRPSVPRITFFNNSERQSASVLHYQYQFLQTFIQTLSGGLVGLQSTPITPLTPITMSGSPNYFSVEGIKSE